LSDRVWTRIIAHRNDPRRAQMRRKSIPMGRVVVPRILGVWLVRVGRIGLMSWRKTTLRSGRGQPGGFRPRGGPGQVRQGIEGRGLIVQTDMGIDAQGQGRGRMPRQGLHDLDRGVALGQRRDVGEAQGVEIGEPLVVFVGDAGVLQVSLQGRQDPPAIHGEQGLAFGPGGQPGLQEGRQGGLDGLHVAPAALAVLGLDRDRGAVAIQVE
jgi:hypothetical protein